MRQIIYRAKKVKSPKSWVYGFLVFCRRIPYIFNSDRFIEVIPDTEVQFTGVLDNKDDEVYEGDLIKIKKRKNDFCSLLDEQKEVKQGDIVEVFYSTCHYACKVLDKEIYFDLFELISDQDNLCGKVIGSIYDLEENKKKRIKS